MAKESAISMKGEVTEALGYGFFKVILENGMEIVCHLSGKMRKFFIKVIAGDSVMVEMSPYDLTKGRISKRL